MVSFWCCRYHIILFCHYLSTFTIFIVLSTPTPSLHTYIAFTTRFGVRFGREKIATMSQLTTTKPSRSDEVLDAEEQLRIAYEIRAHFDALQPGRPVKPNRSEPGSPHAVNHSLSNNDIPELHKFQSLQSSSHVSITSLSQSIIKE